MIFRISFLCILAFQYSQAVESATTAFGVNTESTIRDMLWLAKVTPKDVVYDLSDGDTELVTSAVQDYNVQKAVGICPKMEMVRENRKIVESTGLADRISFAQDSFFDYSLDFDEIEKPNKIRSLSCNLSPASVVTLRLPINQNLALRPHLYRMLRPGTRIVSCRYNMGEWTPTKQIYSWEKSSNIRLFRTNSDSWDITSLPEYRNFRHETPQGNREQLIMLWERPSAVAGVWKGKIASANGDKEFTMEVHQRINDCVAKFNWSGTSTQAYLAGSISGPLSRWWPMDQSSEIPCFVGRIHGDEIEGLCTDSDIRWKAVRRIGNPCGTWELPLRLPSAVFRIRIFKKMDQLMAEFLDGKKASPINDFYDFAGGFAFTYFLPPQGSHSLGTWIIGHAIHGEGGLRGRIEMHSEPGYVSEEDGRKSQYFDWTFRGLPE